jgi:ABC-2 type transport system permease protein
MSAPTMPPGPGRPGGTSTVAREDAPAPSGGIEVRPPARRCSPTRAFFAVLARDIHVTRRELLGFLAQTLIQPFFFLFIFVKVLGGAGFVSDRYGQIALPGMMALCAYFGALQAVTFPLVVDFAMTREIDDRLLAPLPIRLVAVEKMVLGALRGLVASLCIVPIGLLLLGDVSWPLDGLAPALLMTMLGALLGGTMGLTIGTLVPPRRINVMFAVIFVPLMFTGSAQFPWRSLDHVRAFQILCAVNPLTYVSEGIRASLVPSVPHLPYWLSVLVTVVAVAVFGWTGMRGFLHRALD